MKFYLSLALAILSFSITVAAQQQVVTVDTFFSSIAKPEAIDLPLPEYPKDSRLLAGRVSVPIKIDENGNVSVTANVEGPGNVCLNVTVPAVLALRAAAANAAKKAKFTPPVIDGKPVSVMGRINYLFSSPDGQLRMSGISQSKGDSGESTRLDRMTVVRTIDEEKTMGAKPTGKTVSGGVLNGTAMELAKPTYPPAAKAVRAGGAVSVQVLIFEDGTVYSGAAVSGHPLLRHAAEIAACGSKFSPTLLEGTPVKVSGVITYNFVP
ncbi:hypothetical protein BH10ACI2_BH10ACI2_02530 [soil metagenome]